MLKLLEALNYPLLNKVDKTSIYFEQDQELKYIMLPRIQLRILAASCCGYIIGRPFGFQVAGTFAGAVIYMGYIYNYETSLKAKGILQDFPSATNLGTKTLQNKQQTVLPLKTARVQKSKLQTKKNDDSEEKQKTKNVMNWGRDLKRIYFDLNPNSIDALVTSLPASYFSE